MQKPQQLEYVRMTVPSLSRNDTWLETKRLLGSPSLFMHTGEREACLCAAHARLIESHRKTNIGANILWELSGCKLNIP